MLVQHANAFRLPRQCCFVNSAPRRENKHVASRKQPEYARIGQIPFQLKDLPKRTLDCMARAGNVFASSSKGVASGKSDGDRDQKGAKPHEYRKTSHRCIPPQSDIRLSGSLG
jgi:hypothetical protein